jgi:hypothetical protein
MFILCRSVSLNTLKFINNLILTNFNVINILFFIQLVGIFIICPLVSIGCPPGYRNATAERPDAREAKVSELQAARKDIFERVPINLMFGITNIDTDL